MMSPTLLEVTIVLILIVLGWQIGVRIAPTVLAYWQAARQQLHQLDEPPPTDPTLSSSSAAKSNKENNKESNHE